MHKLKKAFTIAEVVVVLLIMGGIAAILTPSLVSNNERTVMLTALKKTYADLLIIKDAMNLEEKHYTKCGPVDLSNDNKLKDTFTNGIVKNYLKVVDRQALKDFKKKKLNDYVKSKKKHDNTVLNTVDLYAVLKNGVLIAPYSDTNKFYVYVDVNGVKSPNVVGRDIFYFVFYKDSEDMWDVNPLTQNTSATLPYEINITGAKSATECITSKCTKDTIETCSTCAGALLDN